MKYLVLTRRKDAFLMLPQEQRIAIWEGMVAYIERYKKVGKCKEIYMDGDMQGSASIWETDSEKEVTNFILENPMSPFMSIETRPVIGWDIAVKAQREYFQKQAK
jgi:Muconolactone delta-isomerase